MAQRLSGFARIADERYETVESWPALALLTQLPDIGWAWDPADDGNGHLVATLHRQGIKAVGSGADFLSVTEPPTTGVTDVITNPPYGPSRRGELARAFIEHALQLPVRRVSMLLAIDFDSAITRQHLFRFCPAFAGKLILLNRVRWIPGSTGSPSATGQVWLDTVSAAIEHNIRHGGWPKEPHHEASPSAQPRKRAR